MASQEEEETQKFSRLISSLPKEVSWSTNEVKYDALHQYKGFWYRDVVIQGILQLQELNSSELNLSSSHVVLCSIPKSGTTWLKALTYSIVTRTRFKPNSDDHPLLSSFPHDLIPILEWIHKHPLIDHHLPLLSTHLPYSALPELILGSSTSKGCKIVYICRNIKDVFISLWQFMRKMSNDEDFITLDKAFDLFSRGVSIYGPYWDHVLGYCKASLDSPEKVLFLKYEDMMEDGIFHVKRLAEFMGYPFSEEEEREGMIGRIVEMCSFGSLSNMKVNKFGRFSIMGLRSVPENVSTSIFFREGKMESWRNYLTEEMSNKLDEISLEKFGKYGLSM